MAARTAEVHGPPGVPRPAAGTTSLRSVLLVAVPAYVAAALFSSALLLRAEVVGIYWPAAGVAAAALLVTRRRDWPVVLGVLLALQVVYNLAAGNALVTLVAWSVANTLGHLLVAWLVQRWRASRLGDVRAVLAFALAALVGSVPAAVVGALGSVISGMELSFTAAALAWLVGDWLGVLTVAPLGLVLVGAIPWPSGRSPELWLVVGTCVAVTGVLFTLPDSRYAAQLSYLVLLPLLWAAMRTRTAGVVLGVAMATSVAVTATTLGRGPFAVEGLAAGGRSVLLHLFLVGMAATALLLASRTVESETHRDVAADRAHLLAAVSHELRTPLTPIVGFSELLLARDRTLAPSTREGLAAIHRNGTHLTALIDDLLLLNDLRDGRVDVAVVEPTDVAAAARRHAAGYEDVAVRVAAGVDTRALVDPSHLERIVGNLLDNAFVHGRPPVRLEVVADRRAVEVHVVDHGHGVPEWFVGRLFEPFTQEVVGDQRSTAGLGLGLSISHELAAANGGGLRYARHADGGAVFTVRFPLAAAGGGAPVEARSVAAARRSRH